MLLPLRVAACWSLARTPSRKTRETPDAGQPLQPTAPRARATVERVQRGQRTNPPPGASPGTSLKGRGGQQGEGEGGADEGGAE